MVNKSKGNKTKDSILSYAKEVFYEYGYKNSLVKTIAKNAGISLGNLTYYFNKKDDIVKEIYEQFISDIYDFIDSNTTEEDALQKYCNFIVIIYSIILSDEKNKRFYSEVILNKSNYRILHELMRNYYRQIIDSLNIELSQNDFEIFVLTEFGSRREIFLNYFSKELDLSFDELIYYLISNMCKSLEIEATEIDRLVQNAFEFIRIHDHTSIRFL